ncbi:MAG TPA: translation initiation factor IF-2 [Candidatus Blautia faecipullorum]|nr:translation initiation factor IF-2 [Candidatus Blautia faecipullorum]
MAEKRVYELAKELGRQNREIIEALKANGVEVKSHMSRLEEPCIRMIKEKFLQMGKEQITKVENSRTEEKMVTSKPEAEKKEAPKKKKNIIRVYHAQNASDGGKNRPKRPGAEKRPGARPQQGQRPQTAKKPAETAAKKPAETVKKPVEAVKKPAEQPVKKPAPEQRNGAEVKAAQTAPVQNTGKPAQRQEQQGNNRSQNHQSRDGRDGRERNRDFRGGERKNTDRGPQQGGRPGNRQQKPGEGRPPRNGEGTGRPQRGQGRPQNGQGRPEGRGDGRFGGKDNRGGQRPGGRRNDSDAVFTPELTKTSKDSKRERDRENKNKKKDFDKLSGAGHRPNQGGKRTLSRVPKALQKPAPQPKQEEKKPEVKEITLPEKLTIRELAEAMKMQPSVIVKKLFMQGVMVTVNHEIDFEKAQEIALEYDIIAEPEEKVDVIGELLKEDEENEADMVSRPPVVCVMGHVDHGKTSLLDAIRDTNVTRGEAGGITQHIGAYVVEINGQEITFLDTPGHEAFTAMRMRGANATDIAVLVVAADDGVMPQTIEAISHAKAAGVEIIVAINKIDKPSANIERVKQELSEYELIPEDWGGSTIFVPVSAHTKEGIDTLLEMILLSAEVCELKANPNRAARGLVIEAKLDKGKGPVATILVQKGTLHVGDFIAAGACSGKVRAMMDDKGRRVKEAGPSTPVEILGLGDVPNAGEILMSFSSDKEAKNFAGAFVSENKNRLLEETKGKLSLDNLFDQIQASDLKELPIIVKADVQGSVEAVKQSLTKLSNEEVVVRVIHGGVGAVNESDVSLAATSNAIIIGFNVRPDAMAKQLADQEGVDLRLYKVIYQAIEDVEAAMKGMLDPVYEEKVIGHAEVRQLFKASGVGTIAGSYILDGIFQRNCKVRITREGEQVYEGELASLKRFKDDVKEVKAGYECGLVFDGFNDVKEEDHVEAYIMVEVPR